MSVSRASSPPCRPLNEQFSLQNDRRQIRVVPYSAPRISPDDPILSRPGTYASLMSHQQVVPGNAKTFDQDHLPARIVSPAAAPVSLSAPALDVNGKGKEPYNPPRRFVTPDGIKSQHSTRQISLSSSLSMSSSPSPWRRPKRAVNLHPDGTFSLVQQPESLSSRTDSISSPVFSYASPSGSYGRMSSTTIIDEHASSSLAPVAEQKLEEVLPSSPIQSPVDPDTGPDSPWNYRLSGSAHKVFADTSDYSLDLSGTPQSFHVQHPEPLAADAISDHQGAPAVSLSTKCSFQSSLSGSILSDRTNYRTYKPTSSPNGSANGIVGLDLGSPPLSSSGSNYVLHDSSSAAQSDDRSIPRSDQSEFNYIIHDRSRSSSVQTGPKTQLRTAFSQESLVIAPLRPVKQVGVERLIHTKSRSCDSSVTTSSKATSSRTASLRSLRSLSNFVHREAPHVLDSTFGILPDEGDDDWRLPAHIGSNSPRRSLSRKKHWSTTLSTVVSEGENGSEPPSRSLSPLFNNPRGNGPHNTHSRRWGSLSSSLAGLDETLANASHSRTASLDRPKAVYNRDVLQNQRLIRDHDEDGDGLAELEDMSRHPSRMRRHNLLSSYSSDRNLHSSGSSRANSLHGGSLPLWVKLYYGSGERRFLSYKPSCESITSVFSDSQPRNSILSRSPSVECYATEINNPRKRPREYVPAASDVISITPTPHPLLLVARSFKKRTSSIWSPHLRHDRRSGRYSIWGPPSLVGFHDSTCLWKRNIQIILFVVGFLLPFGWMIGAILPLPAKPPLEMIERDHSTSHLDLQLESRFQMHDFNELRVRNRTKWWRSVNRRMSFLGVLLIGAYGALAIIGVHQQWATNEAK